MAIPNPQVISTVDTVSDQRLDIDGTVWQLSTNTSESVILYGITDSAGTAYEIGYLKERPAALNFYGSNAAPAVSGETEVTTLGTIASTKFYVDYDRAFMLFPDGHSTPVSVTYKGMGSIQKAKDVNEAIRAGIFSTQNYLGSYASASAPSVDRIGATLIDGALYYNTTDNVLMTYDLGGTTWNRTTPASTEQGHINTVSGISANVTTVAGNNANVSTVAGNNANVTTVAGISGNVTTVAGISSDVTAVVNDATDIGVVAGKNTEIGLLGTSAMAHASTGHLKVLSDINANITTVAGISANTTTVAGISANVTTVAGISANVTTVATNVAGVNSFAERYRVASSDPSSANNDGDLVWNTTSDQLKIYNATTSAWVAPYLDSAAVTTIASNEAVAMSIALG